MNAIKSNIFLEMHAKSNTVNEAGLPSEIMLLPASPAKGRDGREFKYTAEEVLNG